MILNPPSLRFPPIFFVFLEISEKPTDQFIMGRWGRRWVSRHTASPASSTAVALKISQAVSDNPPTNPANHQQERERKKLRSDGPCPANSNKIGEPLNWKAMNMAAAALCFSFSARLGPTYFLVFRWSADSTPGGDASRTVLVYRCGRFWTPEKRHKGLARRPSPVCGYFWIVFCRMPRRASRISNLLRISLLSQLRILRVSAEIRN